MPRWRLGPLVLLGLAVGVASASGPGGQTAARVSLILPATAPGPRWSIVPSRNLPGRTGQLAGVSCPGSSSCTAVGDFTRRSGVVVTLAEQWDGSKWAIQARGFSLPARWSS
jgi:hypothetical protein